MAKRLQNLQGTLPQPLLCTGSDEAVVGDDGGCGGYLAITGIPIHFALIVLLLLLNYYMSGTLQYIITR